MAARTRNAAPEEPQGEPTQAVTTTTAATAQVAVQVNPQVTAFRRVEAALNARSDALLAVLPGKVGVDRFMRVALGAMSRQPKLFDCTTESLVKSMLDAAELGLEPSGLMGQAYLVPHRNTRAGTTEATLIIGYRGLAELARRSGQVANVEARVVRQRDVFQVSYGTSPSITHVPYLPGLMGAPAPGADDAPVDGAGPFLACYAVLSMKDGTTVIDVMTQADVDAIRKRSRSGQDGPWVTDYQEMARKTVLRRALKWAPVSIVDLRVAEVLDREDQAQFGPQGDPGQAAVQVATQAPAAITAASAAFRQGASGQANQDEGGIPAWDAPVTAQEAPGQVEAFQADPVAAPAPDDDPGASMSGGFTPGDGTLAIGLKVKGKATGKAGPARCASTASNGVGCQLPSGHDLPHQGDDQSWVNPEDRATVTDGDFTLEHDAQGQQVVTPHAAPDAMVACEDPSPYGDGTVCLMPKGHAKAHRSQEGAW